MSKKVRQPFTPGGKFVAFKNFKFGGRMFEKGDEFPWRRLACSVRQLRKLYEGRYLNNVYVEEDKLMKEEILPDPDDLPDTEEDVEEDEEDEDVELVYDPDRHEIVNPERGEWYMDLDGEHLLRLTAKEAKRLRKSMKTTEIDSTAVIED